MLHDYVCAPYPKLDYLTDYLHSADFFYMMRCIPVSSGKTKMEYDVFRRNDTTDEDFARINDFYKQVLQEDKDLCNGTQKNLEAGIFINGQLHPEKEKVGGCSVYRRDKSFLTANVVRYIGTTVLPKDCT
jgi:hypothetical protein